MSRSQNCVIAAVLLGFGAAGCGGGAATSSNVSQASASVPTTSATTSATTHATTTSSTHAKSGSHKAKPKKAHHSSTSTSSASKSTTSTTTSHTTTTPKPHHTRPPAPVGPVHATLTAENHAPTVNRPWPYTVHVTDARGTPVSGRVEIEFVFSGQVVGRDTPPTHPLTDGRWHDVLKFPAQSVGIPLIVQAVVHTRVGSATLDWSVKVRR